MMISKVETIKKLRMLGILCAIAMGFMCLVGCGEEAVTDALGIDTDVNESAEITLDPVTTSFSSVSSIQANGDCGAMTIQQVVNEIEQNIGQDLDNIKDLSITVNDISGTYTASWEPPSEGPISYYLSITGTQSTDIAVTVIESNTGIITKGLTQDNRNAINYYLSNWNEPFDYCLSCYNTQNITFYSVTFEALVLGVQITGKASL
jgi:hypothetical protein